MKKVLLILFLISKLSVIGQKISHYEKVLQDTLYMEISEVNAKLSYKLNDKLLEEKIHILYIDVDSEENFYDVFTKLVKKHIPFKMFPEKNYRKKRNALIQSKKYFYAEYLKTKKIDSDTAKSGSENKKTTTTNSNDSTDKLGPAIRFTIGWNSNDIHKFPKGSVYVRFSYFYFDTFNCNFKPRLLGAYFSLFKQSYNIKNYYLGQHVEKRIISSVSNNKFKGFTEHYRRDSVQTRLDQIGLLISPQYLILKNKSSFRNKPEIKVWLNLDLEISYFKYYNIYSDILIGKDSINYPLDLSKKYVDSSTFKGEFTNNYQAQAGVGFTFSAKSKSNNFEVLLKPSLGFMNIITPLGLSNFYHMCYLTFSQKSTGFRVGTEYRAYLMSKSISPKPYNVYWNFFAGYAISFEKLAALFK